MSYLQSKGGPSMPGPDTMPTMVDSPSSSADHFPHQGQVDTGRLDNPFADQASSIETRSNLYTDDDPFSDEAETASSKLEGVNTARRLAPSTDDCQVSDLDADDAMVIDRLCAKITDQVTDKDTRKASTSSPSVTVSRSGSKRRALKSAASATGSVLVRALSTGASFGPTAYSVPPVVQTDKPLWLQARENGWSKTSENFPVTLTMSKKGKTEAHYNAGKTVYCASLALDGDFKLCIDREGISATWRASNRQGHLPGDLAISPTERPVFSLGADGPVTHIEKLPNDMFLLELSETHQAFVVSKNSDLMWLCPGTLPKYCRAEESIALPLVYPLIVSEYNTRASASHARSP